MGYPKPKTRQYYLSEEFAKYALTYKGEDLEKVNETLKMYSLKIENGKVVEL